MREIALIFILILSSCTFVQPVMDGKMAYDLKQYQKAIPLLEKSYKSAKTKKEKANIAFKIANSYQKNSLYGRSYPWFKSAYDQGYGIEAKRGMAYSMKSQGKYEEAITLFQELALEIGSNYEFKKDIAACKTSILWESQKQFTGYTVIPKENINSPSDDYSMSFGPKKMKIFLSDKTAENKKSKYPWTNRSFTRMYQYNPDNESADIFSPLGSDFLARSKKNYEVHFGPLTMSNDGLVIMTICERNSKVESGNCALFSTKLLSEAGSSDWELLEFCKDNKNYIHPAITEDGNTLIFSSDESGGIGGYDLYQSQKTRTGWTSPKLLNRTINTAGDEVFPIWNKDTLFFSSNGLQGMGGLDIFKSIPLNLNSWSPPLNLKSPINSSGDDFSYLVESQNEKSSKGYLSSSRNGNTDIYSFDKIPSTYPPVVLIDTLKKQNKIVLSGYIVEPIYENPEDQNSREIGKKVVEKANVSVSIVGTPKINLTTDASGYFETEIPFDKTLTILAEKKDYLSNSQVTSSIGFDKNLGETQRIEIEILIRKIQVNKEIVLKDIFYDFDKWDIRDDAKPSLMELAEILKLNPSLKIQLGSHTDCRGKEDYNQTLSQKRAESAVEFLVGIGISNIRLSSVGYGESSLLTDCPCNKCTEDDHQRNRRTTFKIIE
jgi:peptidoglycan-associated lipoprotein